MKKILIVIDMQKGFLKNKDLFIITKSCEKPTTLVVGGIAAPLL